MVTGREGKSCPKADETVYVAKGFAITSTTCWINFNLTNGRIIQAARIQITCLYTPHHSKETIGEARHATRNSITETKALKD